MEKVSVIIPIYNVEKYIKYCLDSLIHQSYKNLQIILVDDGSTDSSSEICDEYAMTDERVEVMHKANEGPSSARNAGIQRADGDYIAFIDSDDVICASYIEILLNLSKENHADLVACDYSNINSDSTIDENTSVTDGNNVFILDNKEAVRAYYRSSFNGINTVAWGKIYRASLIKDNLVLFPHGRINEDIYTMYKLLYLSNKTVYYDEILYYYRKRPESIMDTSRKNFSENNMLVLEGTEEAVEFFSERGEKDLAALALNYHARLSFGLNYKLQNCDYISKETKKLYLRKMKASLRKWLGYRYLGMFKQILYRIITIFPIKGVLKIAGF